MKFKVDRGLVPVKAHFFFFFAALGPLLPQMNVFGSQLGVSPGVMGLVNAVLPLLWATAKPCFGYLVDYFTNQRKLIFMLLIVLMTGSYCGLWFLPAPEGAYHESPIEKHVYHLNDTIYIEKITEATRESDQMLEKYHCHWDCHNDTFDMWLSNGTYVSTIYVNNEVTNASCSFFRMDFNDVREGQIICTPRGNCNLMCMQEDLFSNSNETMDHVLNNTVPNNAMKRDIETDSVNTIDSQIKSKEKDDKKLKLVSVVLTQSTVDEKSVGGSLYVTSTFWWFVVLMCVGTVAFNVANCIGDAVCFDVLGPDRGSKYGWQRAWGTAGYGLTALFGGLLVDLVSPGDYKDFTPAFLLALVFTTADLFSCRALKLPSLSAPADSGKALLQLMRIPRVVLFISFAVIAGIFDSFIIYYMFWYLEELARVSGHTARIKLIEGVVVAAQSFIGELLFFSLSGRIIKRWGYGATMTFSLLCYGVRMALVSLITNPWHLVFTEAIMQGPSYALCYSCIVGYAARVAPEGYSATVQGIVAGMDDGLGFALGSLLGGALYSCVGGARAFQVMSLAAAAAATAHAALRRIVADEVKPPPADIPEEGEKMLQLERDSSNVIYKDTVIPLIEEKNTNNNTR